MAVCFQTVYSACPLHVPSLLYWTPEAYYEYKSYIRQCQGLSTIPDNIPAEAVKVEIQGNSIRIIPADAFSQLSHCTELSLSYNEIERIEPGAFSQLPALNRLWLEDNKLTTLPWTVFTNGTGNITRPAHLKLALGNNPFQCDTSLCWMKQAEWTQQAEQDGWLIWEFNVDPDCANYPIGTQWEDVNLQCDTMGK